MIRIETVDSPTQFREFVQFPLSIYANNSPWVPPMWSDEIKRLDPNKGPFFDHSDAQLFLARDTNGNLLGRIAAIKFNGHLDVYKDRLGFFGFFIRVSFSFLFEFIYPKVDNDFVLGFC